MRTRRVPGYVLVITVSLLALLGVLGLTYAAFSRVEREVSENYIAQLRARMLAEAGLGYAISRLQRLPFLAAYEANLYWDLNDKDKDGNLTELFPPEIGTWSTEASEELLENVTDKSKLSFPCSVSVACSGTPLPGTYREHGDHFRVRLRDAASQIHINMDTRNCQDVARLNRMLNDVGEALGLDGKTNWFAQQKDGKTGKTVTQRIIDLRKSFDTSPDPKRRFFRWERELRQVLSPEEYNGVRDYITVYSWVDSTVIRPQPAQASIFPAALQTKNSTSFPVYQPRAPVNINTASLPVLYSVLKSLRGYALDQGQRTDNSPKTEVFLLSGSPSKTSIPYQLADLIIKWRRRQSPFGALQEAGPFRNVGDLAHFLARVEVRRDVLGGGVSDPQVLSDLSMARIGLILANCLPGSRLNRTSPTIEPIFDLGGGLDHSFVPLVEKFDLADSSVYPRNTTEFCFNSGGYYEIESLGRIMGLGVDIDTGRPIAQSKVFAAVKLFDILRHANQSQFEEHRTGYEKTATYPESLEDTPVPSDMPSQIDGWIQLSTEGNPSGGSTENYHFAFRDKLDPDQPLAAGPAFASFTMQKQERTDTTPDLSCLGGPSVVGESFASFPLSDLLPDGLFGYRAVSGVFGTPGMFSWFTANAISASTDHRLPFEEGTMSFWFKFFTIDSTGGNGSVLAYAITPALRPLAPPGTWVPQTSGATNGVGWRLELLPGGGARGRLVSTRFYWQSAWNNPPNNRENATTPPSYPATWPIITQTSFDIPNSWRPGQWHHISVKWQQVTGQGLYVDFVRSGSPGLGTYLPVQHFLQGGGQNGGDLVRQVLLASAAAQPHLHLMGYSFNAVGTTIGGQLGLVGYNLPNAQVLRFADATIDEIRIWNGASGLISGFPAGPVAESRRYQLPPGRFEAKFPHTVIFPSDDPLSTVTSRIASVSWSVYPAPSGVLARLAYRIGSASYVQSTAPETQIGSMVVNKPILWDQDPANREEFQYQIRFALPAGGAPARLESSPTVDDVTVTVVRPPRIVASEWIRVE